MVEQVLSHSRLLKILTADPGSIYGSAVIDQIPRILGQIDRNPHSPTYGSCCRNFWHYRIEDISNSQMQEAVLTLALAYTESAAWNPYYKSSQLFSWVEAVLHYWTLLQQPSGCFDEVYRGQNSYAATAFSSYCVSEAAIVMGSKLDAHLLAVVNESLNKAVDWLNETDEELACNQIAGAAAAMYNSYLLEGRVESKQAAKRQLAKLQKLQNEEGWFNEYGGADIGYSSLTLDYLCKLWEKSGWDEAMQMALSLLEFLTFFIHQDGTAGGVHGSRNTEYIIPHGIEMLAPHIPAARSISNLLLSSLVEHKERSILARLDDRYLCYLSGFFMQAAVASVPRADISIDLPFKRKHSKYFPRAGLWSMANNYYHLVANVAKGGVLRCDYHDGNSFQNAGLFVVNSRGKTFTTQVLQLPADVRLDGKEATIDAPLGNLQHVLISPWRALAFKAYNLILPGSLRRLVLDYIRRLAISSGDSLSRVHRTIRAESDWVYVHDSMVLPQGSFLVRIALATERAFSFASCGFFHPAELEQESSRSIEKHIDGPCRVEIVTKLSAEGWHLSEWDCVSQDRAKIG